MERADEARKARSVGSRNEMFWRIIWPLVIVIIFGGAVLFANGCGGGGGGSSDNSNSPPQSQASNSPSTDNQSPPADDNQNPPSNQNSNPPPDGTQTSPPSVQTAGVIQLPKTGQTVSYAKGDDGDIQSGASWPNPRFTDNGNGTVTDNLTGLMWMKNLATIQNKVTSLAAASSVDKINRGLINTGTPYIDWRIPNLHELRSINDFSRNDAALLIKYFPNIKDEFYWTSTTLDIVTYAVNPKVGIVERLSSNYYYYFTDTIGKANLWLVRGLSTGLTAVPKTGQTKCYGPEEGSTHQVDCNKRSGWIVKSSGNCYYKWKSGTGEYTIEIPCDAARQDGQYQSGIAWPISRFIDNGDNTVTDHLTGLMWTKKSRAMESATWQQALDFVAQMNKDGKFGHSDWRLPNINELISVIDCSGMYTVSGCSVYPVFGVEGRYWSSTTYAGDANLAWYWGDWLLEYGIQFGAKNNINDVWPVRTIPAK